MAMLSHQIHYRQIRHRREFPGAVQLHFGNRLQAGLPGPRPFTLRSRPGADRRHGIFIHRPLDPAAVDRQPPFADRHQPSRLRQSCYDIRRIAVAVPCPIPNKHFGLGIPKVNALLNRCIGLRNDVGVLALFAVRTRLPFPVRSTVR